MRFSSPMKDSPTFCGFYGRTFIRDCNRFFTESQSKAKMIEYTKELVWNILE